MEINRDQICCTYPIIKVLYPIKGKKLVYCTNKCFIPCAICAKTPFKKLL